MARAIAAARTALVVALACILPASAAASVRRVWAVNDGEKVERDDGANAAARGNSTWDGRTVRIFGARNEVIAFQLVVEADARGIARLRVALPELARRGGGGRIAYAPPGPDPSNAVGRPIQIFTENYMHVTEPTHAEWIYRPGSPSAPSDRTGWKPVQLVPENARQGRGGFPLSVPARHNQAIWIEVYTARDLPAGVYAGQIEVEADGRKSFVPVELELFDFTLPDENSMSAMVYYECQQPLLYQGADLDAEYNRFAHRNRIEFVHSYDLGDVRASMGRFDGSDYTRARGYEGPGEGVGDRVIPRGFYGPPKEYEERASAWQDADAWMTFLRTSVPRAITFLYMPDEPGPSEYAHIRALADNVHSNPGPGRDLPVFVTKKYTKELDGAIDIWDSGPDGFDIKRAAEETARGRRSWVYNGGRPGGGAIVVDAPATDPRATIWACFKHGVEVYFYWNADHWLHNRQKVGDRRQNVWANPITFDNRGQPNKPADSQGWANGDGVLVYPGTELIHPDEDRGVRGPVSTVQLANLRRGLQDHLYLTLARELGLGGVVDEALAAVVPRVFSDAGATVGFAEHGEAYEKVRYRLAREIARRAGRKAGGAGSSPQSAQETEKENGQ